MLNDTDMMLDIEVQGIKLTIDKTRFEDPRFMYALGKVSDEELDEFQQLKWSNRVMDTLFGDESYRIMCKLADGGKLTIERWNDFLGDVMEAARVKNLQRSQERSETTPASLEQISSGTTD